MKRLFLFVLFIANLQSFAQSNTKSNATSWNKVLTGTIGNYPATMYIQKTGQSVNGYYYYNNKQIAIKLNDKGSNGNSICLLSYRNDITEIFKGTYVNGNFKGIWEKSDSDQKTKLSFSFNESTPSIIPYFDIIYTDSHTEYPIVTENNAKPSYGYFAAAIWPAENTPIILSDFLKKSINGMFGHPNTIEPIGSLFVADKNKIVSYWKKELDTEEKNIIKKDPNGFSKSEEKRILIMYQSEQYLSVAYSEYKYTNSGTPNGATVFSVLDFAKRKQLTINDILTPLGKQKLITLIEKALKEELGISENAILDVNENSVLLTNRIEITNNFYITSKGIGFDFGSYLTGAYTLGESNFFIPFEKLKGFLQANFKY